MATHLDSIKKSIQKTKAYKAISTNINYNSVKGYSSTKNIAVNLASQILITEQYLNGKMSGDLVHTVENITAQAFLYAAKTIERELTPCYWLASELAESLIATDIPDNWSGLKPFIEKGILLLPKNCLEYSGFGETESVDWLYFEVMTSSPEFQSENMRDKPIILWTSGNDRLSVFFGSIDFESTLSNDNSSTNKDKEIIDRVNKLLLNTMLVLNYKPELLDEQQGELKGVGFGRARKLPSSVPRNPVWIGKVYSLVREHREINNKLVREVREHYRRGHWARRRHGTREKWQHQWHWIEPTIVNYVE